MQGRQNQALEQTRDNVLRYGEVVGCELLNFFVRQQEAQSQSNAGVTPMVGLGPASSDGASSPR
jgi:hypothetical protein